MTKKAFLISIIVFVASIMFIKFEGIIVLYNVSSSSINNFESITIPREKYVF